MSPLAEILALSGIIVRGSDSQPSTATQRLQSLNVSIAFKQTAENIAGAKTIVYSSAIANDNPELVAARAANLRVLHRSDLLNELMASKKSITIAGTHGKTTTAAMIAHTLTELGKDPTVVVGGVMRNFSSSARLGKSEFFVAEADESDGSFLKYSPFVSVLTNIDNDHLDHFTSHDAMRAAFLKYMQNSHTDGGTVLGWDNKIVREVAEGFLGNKIACGFQIGSHIRATDYVARDGKAIFNAMVQKQNVRCQLNAFGRHNVCNALVTLGTMHLLGLDIKQAATALSSFAGVDRRMSLIVNHPRAIVFDDYAHNPGKIQAAITSLKEAFPRHMLHVIFQPHRFSRLETMYGEITRSFVGASNVYVIPVYAAGETPKPEFTPERIANDIALASNVICRGIDDSSTISRYLMSKLTGSNVILTLGAGDVWKIADHLRTMLSAQG